MKLNIYLIMILVSILFQINIVICLGPKIIGLMQVRNEENIIEQSVRGLAQYADEIVILNDNSVDATSNILQKLQEQVPFLHIIDQKICAWQESTEFANRTTLLTYGRKLGGTHFILMDADELFSAQCLENNWLRTKILQLKPGQGIAFPMINLWNGTTHYRDDATWNPRMDCWKVEAVFCDDRICSYLDNPVGISKTIHISRFPFNLKYQSGKYRLEYITDLNYSIIHFKSCNITDLHIKKIWYMFLELIRMHESNTTKKQHIAHASQLANAYNGYANADTFANVHTSPIKKEWLRYSFFNSECFMAEHTFRKNDLRAWVQRYGKEFFEPLNLTQEEWRLFS